LVSPLGPNDYQLHPEIETLKGFPARLRTARISSKECTDIDDVDDADPSPRINVIELVKVRRLLSAMAALCCQRDHCNEWLKESD